MGFDLRSLVALSMSGVVGSAIHARLRSAFGDSLADVTAAQLRGIEGVGGSGAASIVRALRSDAPEREMDRCRSAGVSLLAYGSADYPPMLAPLIDMPLVLFVRGRLDPAPRAALVGTRHPSGYGLRIAGDLARGLARDGVTVVSGLARGVDGAAHRGVLEAGGRTIAVLGCGLGGVYPPEHSRLAERIAGSGALVSELPMNAPPRPSHFPRRNRIISGLAWITVCVEASLTSGAISTCDWALEQGRAVGAVPGPADSPRSSGAHHLIRQGARLVEDAFDILEEIPLKSDVPADPVQRVVLRALRSGAKGLSGVCRATGLRGNVAARVMRELGL